MFFGYMMVTRKKKLIFTMKQVLSIVYKELHVFSVCHFFCAAPRVIFCFLWTIYCLGDIFCSHNFHLVWMSALAVYYNFRDIGIYNNMVVLLRPYILLYLFFLFLIPETLKTIRMQAFAYSYSFLKVIKFFLQSQLME